ncbi:exopolysaccharide production protein ExoZ [Rhizobium sp. BK313]|uniref:acyltransferase family protein n=1 Tax=Rhizobium sp. BK313 TaxID=2587081 RepID=UPI0010618A11|nr:acyltransferase [Rhizobium sp. BK313]MBB3457461.1 exopolysaccharide production protein ExoZ [Rhizobium sp. BK313]
MLESHSQVRSIQYLRALAAISVVFFHVSETYDLGFKIGASGVDIFFVISGFIMWVTTQGKLVSPQEFMSRRISRIVPVYWIATIVTVVVITVKPLFFFDVDPSAENLIGSLFFLPLIKDEALHPVVVQGWTLSYEMFFYLIFSISLLLSEFNRFCFLVIALVLLVALHSQMPFSYARAFTEPVILEFAAGVIIGRLWTQNFRIPFHIAMALMTGGVVLLLTSALLPDVDRVVRWGVPATLLVLGVAFAERERGSPELAVVHFLGDASYSIYIWHVLTGVVVTAILLRVGTPHAALPLLVVAGSLGLTLICYVLIERPMLRLTRRSRTKTVPE